MARPGPRPLLRRSITADAVELYAAGRSCSQVAAELGVAATTVRHALADAGVPRRPRNGRLDVDVDAIVRRYRDGSTMAEVADQLGVSEALVRERLTAAALAGDRRVTANARSRADLPPCFSMPTV